MNKDVMYESFNMIFDATKGNVSDVVVAHIEEYERGECDDNMFCKYILPRLTRVKQERVKVAGDKHNRAAVIYLFGKHKVDGEVCMGVIEQYLTPKEPEVAFCYYADEGDMQDFYEKED